MMNSRFFRFTRPFRIFFVGVDAAAAVAVAAGVAVTAMMLVGLPQRVFAQQNAPQKNPLPLEAPGTVQVCSRAWLSRLPGIDRAQCLAAQLRPSGSLSHQGRTLYLRDVLPPTMGHSDAPLRVLVVGAIHGDELTSAALALRWLALAQEGSLARAVHWRFIPVLNPDGLLALRPRRVNARGVDLNRNFATPNWAQEAPKYWEKRTRKDPRRWPGPAPLSEPETQFLQTQLDGFDPHLVVSIHAPYGVLDFDGPHDPPQRLGRLHLEKVGIFPGSLGHYGGIQQGLPVVTIELEHALQMPREGEIRAMWNDLLDWMDSRQPPLAQQKEHYPYVASTTRLTLRPGGGISAEVPRPENQKPLLDDPH